MRDRMLLQMLIEPKLGSIDCVAETGINARRICFPKLVREVPEVTHNFRAF